MLFLLACGRLSLPREWVFLFFAFFVSYFPKGTKLLPHSNLTLLQAIPWGL